MNGWDVHRIPPPPTLLANKEICSQIVGVRQLRPALIRQYSYKTIYVNGVHFVLNGVQIRYPKMYDFTFALLPQFMLEAIQTLIIQQCQVSLNMFGSN